MSERLMDLSCSEFARVLAAKEPVPGGGGAAALVGALAAALCSMVGNFTVGKKTYAEVENDIQRMLGEAERIRERFLELSEEDAQAFVPLSRAYALPKEDPERDAILEEATKAACKAPFEMMQECARVIDLLEEMGQKGSKMLLSDVVCGAVLARSALEAASMNVFVNTKSLQDRDYARQLETECRKLLECYVPRASTCAASVMTRIKA